MNSLVRAFDTGFDSLFSGIPVIFDDFLQQRRVNRYDEAPRFDVVKTDEGLKIELEAPGLQKENFKITVNDGCLTVSTNIEKKDAHKFYKKSFARSWVLEKDVISDQISATYMNGILEIGVPYKKPKENKEIVIDVK